MSSGLEEKKAMASSCQSLISSGLMLCLPLLMGIVAQPAKLCLSAKRRKPGEALKLAYVLQTCHPGKIGLLDSNE